ncbi:MAG: hypothetical protein U1C71_00840, partial [archaeon]|nr:hypothetical protein [archaeon]
TEGMIAALPPTTFVLAVRSGKGILKARIHAEKILFLLGIAIVSLPGKGFPGTTAFAGMRIPHSNNIIQSYKTIHR